MTNFTLFPKQAKELHRRHGQRGGNTHVIMKKIKSKEQIKEVNCEKI